MSHSSTNPLSDQELAEALRFGLARAIQIHSEKLRASCARLALDLDLVDDEKMLSESACTVLYRVYLEAMANIQRHLEDPDAPQQECAGAVWIRYYPLGGDMVLEIRDGGRGFSIPADWARFASSRAGVVGMKPRIEAAGGTLSITPLPGGGTQIHTSLPMPGGHNSTSPE